MKTPTPPVYRNFAIFSAGREYRVCLAASGRPLVVGLRPLKKDGRERGLRLDGRRAASLIEAARAQSRKITETPDA